jgi:hypothetical protein
VSLPFGTSATGSITDDYLRKCLRRLREEMWIDYDMKPAHRGPYVIRLGERYFAALLHGTDLLPELSPDLRLTYDPANPSRHELASDSEKPKELSMADGNGAGDNPRPVPDPSPRERDERREKEKETSGTEVLEASSSNETLPREGAA